MKKSIDWDALLADAQARGLTQVEVAREQGVSQVNVCKVARRRGVVLACGRAAIIAETDARWKRWFAESPPPTIRARDFSRRYGVVAEYARFVARLHGVSTGAVTMWARRFGHRFAPSASRAKGLRDLGKQPKREA